MSSFEWAFFWSHVVIFTQDADQIPVKSEKPEMFFTISADRAKMPIQASQLLHNLKPAPYLFIRQGLAATLTGLPRLRLGFFHEHPQWLAITRFTRGTCGATFGLTNIQ